MKAILFDDICPNRVDQRPLYSLLVLDIPLVEELLMRGKNNLPFRMDWRYYGCIFYFPVRSDLTRCHTFLPACRDTLIAPYVVG